MRSFEARTADELWRSAATLFADDKPSLQDKPDMPRVQESRVGPTREILHASFLLTDPRQRWVFSREPALNPAFALAEVIWILGGRNDAAFLNAWNAKLPEYCGYGDTYHGAYGYRLRKSFGVDQLDRVYEALRANPSSRQAVMMLWNPTLDLPHPDGTPQNQDIPCNIASFARIRQNRLEWTQVMRSNDLLLGLPHNIVQFTVLQEILAGWLGVELGEYYHLSDSLHVYDRDALNVQRAVAQAHATNTDSLCLPKASFDAVLEELIERVELLASEELSLLRISAIVNTWIGPS